ncbi:MAG: VWA domain-containing protein [Pseudorhodobacter sp.]|nr:MAG: VWA domain-containing protein [Pseudorhodobacter sp.]
MRPLSLSLAFCAALATPALSEGQSILVLDASGSMWGQIDGRAKLEIAREALAKVVGEMPGDTAMGLMAYGHREKGSCEDIELIVPPAPGTGPAIVEAANAMKFLGKTPLSESVRRAAEALKYTEDKATVILITDGIETCNADPCALGNELEAAGVDFTAHVVGFGLTAEEGAQVACLAENTGGKYIEAKDAGSLQEALKTAVVAEPEPAPEPQPEPEPEPEPAKLAENVDPILQLVAGGPEPDEALLADAYFSFRALAADGSVSGDEVTIYGRSLGALPAGKYQMVTTLHEAVVTQQVEIAPETDLSQPVAILDAGVLSLKVLAEEGGEPHPEALWEMRGPEDVYDSGYAKALRVFPAAEYALNAQLGEVKASDAVVITAGEITEKTVLLSAGIPVFTAYYAPGVPVDGDQTFEVVEAKVGLDGNRVSVRTDYGAGSAPELPPGEYVVVGSVGPAKAEVPFTVKAGERAEVPVVLNAGIAAFDAPNATAIEIVGAKAGLDGNRPHVYTHYGPELVLTLTAGDYVAMVASGEAKAEFPFSVKPAERVEVKAAVAVGVAAITAPGADEVVLLAGKAGLDGNREQLGNQYSDTLELNLPPGDYLARATAGNAVIEAPVTVKPDERVEITLPLAVGAVLATAPGAKAVAILAAKPDLQGNRAVLGNQYRDSIELKLAPGDYVAQAEYDDGSMAETAFTVANGARAEVTVTKP